MLEFCLRTPRWWRGVHLLSLQILIFIKLVGIWYLWKPCPSTSCSWNQSKGSKVVWKGTGDLPRLHKPQFLRQPSYSYWGPVSLLTHTGVGLTRVGQGVFTLTFVFLAQSLVSLGMRHCHVSAPAALLGKSLSSPACTSCIIRWHYIALCYQTVDLQLCTNLWLPLLLHKTVSNYLNLPMTHYRLVH